MKAPSPEFVVYLAGVALLGLLYEPVKRALGGGGLFALSAIAYLLVLRLLGWLVARAWNTKRPRGTQ